MTQPRQLDLLQESDKKIISDLIILDFGKPNINSSINSYFPSSSNLFQSFPSIPSSLYLSLSFPYTPLLSTVKHIKNTNELLPINNPSDSLNRELEQIHLNGVENKTLLFPHFIINSSTLHIPNKVESVLRKEQNIKKELKKINEDEEVAIELCLMFISNLSNAHFLSNNEKGWKSLWSPLLKEQLGRHKNGKFIYRLVIDFLSNEKLFKRGKIIHVGSYSQGSSTKYRMDDRFFRKGITTYELKTDKLLSKRRKSYYEALSVAQENVIGSYMLKLYGMVELPTEKQIIARAKAIIKAKKKVGKGKLLKFKRRNSRSTIDTSEFSIVEECIDIFKQLTKKGYMIPASSELAGGRVCDSFSLMPSWIRDMCKINKNKIVDCDYTCLHPNIAMKIYGGKINFITHQMVAGELDLPKQEVKIEHLSFFNKTWKQMERSVLFPYYEKNCPHMLNNIFNRKNEDNDITKRVEDGHKNACLDLFGGEVELLTEVIKKLSKEDIYGFYVYDAIKPSAKDEARVIEIMNNTAWEMGIKTSVNEDRPKEKEKEVNPVAKPIVKQVKIKPMTNPKEKFDIDSCFDADYTPRAITVATMIRRDFNEGVNRNCIIKRTLDI